MLTLEWRRRLENWQKELPRHFYRPIGNVELAGFVTKAQLTVEQAEQCEFEPMPPGTEWGAKWEYGWFKGQVTLPEEIKGKRVALKIDVGAESAIYVNGTAAGAVDYFHKEITLAMEGVPGTQYEVMVEGYGGHGRVVVSTGPVPLGRETLPEPGPTQRTMGQSTFGIWEEEIYQLWLDVQTLFEVRENLHEDSLRVQEIDAGLRDFTVIVDLELPHEEMMETVHAARERLTPLLECVNGSTAPTLYAFGHAHIDVAWLWPLAETERKCVRTFSSQLALMEEYPEFKFLQSQPHLYWMVKMHYPKLYARVQKAIQSGQFIPEGGTWVEPDTNVTSGESLIRQFVHGKRFYQQEFGVDCEMLWLPDVFGYSGALPQIMRGCAVKYFSTQKIFWAYNGGAPFPYNTFIWEGIDGSEVYVHLHNDYNSRMNPNLVIQRWRERVQKNGFSTRLMPFGWGDGGGGPTRNHLEYARRLRDLEGVPRVQITHPIDYFHDQEARGWPQERYVGELYFQAHRGTYTSQARTKRGNRKSEFALREAEMWSVAAMAFKGFAFPAQVMDEMWKLLLLNHFHDIIPGSSIHRVYVEAEADYGKIISTVNDVAEEAASTLVENARALTVFNSLSWPRTAVIALPNGFEGAMFKGGQTLPTQQVEDKILVEVTVPACGWTTLYPTEATASLPSIKASKHLLENEMLRIELNEKGEITSIYDKEMDRELAAGLCNSIKMYKDVPTAWDAWDLDSMYPLTPVELEEPAKVEVVYVGPLEAKLRVVRPLHHSSMIQEIVLRRGSRRVDFHTVIDWQESHKLLKVNFPVDIYAKEAVHEIQFGHIRRPTHQSRPFDADRFEVANQKWTALMEENRGCAVLNDCKHGVNVDGNSINLTLLKSALAPDMTADKGRQVFSYAFYAWNTSFADSPLVQEAYDLNVPVMSTSGEGGEQSLFSVDAPNIIIEAVKPAEDGEGVVVRLYEAKRMATRCTLTTALPAVHAAQTNMLEETEQDLALNDGQIALDFRPFEIKTIRLMLK